MFQICRTCLQQISDANYVSLTKGNKSTELKTQLALCVPEMIINLATLTEPIMCIPCVTALHAAYTFKNKCLQTEEQIRNYLQRKQIGINLGEVVGVHNSVLDFESTNTTESDFQLENFNDSFIKEEFEAPDYENDVEKLTSDEKTIDNDSQTNKRETSNLNKKKELQALLRQPSKQTKSSSEKPHKCDKCPFSTGDRSTLTKHKATHSDERPFQCNVCGYCTKRKDALTLHTKTHRAVKPNICPECKYSAVTKQCLRRHIMVVHLGLRPYKCDQCHFSFADRGALTKHMLTHTNVKPYKCKLCEFSTKRKYTLANHIKSHGKGTI